MLGTTLFHFAAYKGHFENLINNERLTTLHKAGTAFYLLKLKIESQGYSIKATFYAINIKFCQKSPILK